MAKQTKEFKTEVKQLLDLVIHSLYSNKEIFLRELISNASDAIDKARFEALTNKKIETEKPQITIEFDKEKKELIISDNGIGMTSEEVENNIGTIARSGTKAFMKQLKEKGKNSEMIGQFGVGFYSAFMVANKVTMITKKAGEDVSAVRWESQGEGEYTIENAEKTTQGTQITLHLKEEFDEFLSNWRIESVIRKFSDYISYPVVVISDKVEENEDKTETVTKEERIVNSQKAIWTRAKAEISAEEYSEFYKHVSHDYNEPLKTIHWTVEGNTEFKALVFIPEKTPMDFMMPEQKRGLNLYVKKVFITDECKEILPDYLRFVKGVVDSADLPLNVSREILQEDKLIRVIEKNVVKKVLDTLKEMKEKDYEKYLIFWKNFGKVLKEGAHFDFANREKIQDLMLFDSINNSEKFIDLAQYVKNMPEDQKEIFVITANSKEIAKNSPLLESFKKRGYDVLIMTDPIDHWVLQAMQEFDGKKIKNIAKGDVEFGSEEEQKSAKVELEKVGEKFTTLIGVIKKVLADDVKEVKISNRLTDSVAVLVADAHGIDNNMAKILEAMGQEIPKNKRILELNPENSLVNKLNDIATANVQDIRLTDYSNLIFDLALLAEGSTPRKPQELARKVSELMLKN